MIIQPSHLLICLRYLNNKKGFNLDLTKPSQQEEKGMVFNRYLLIKTFGINISELTNKKGSYYLDGDGVFSTILINPESNGKLTQTRKGQLSC